MRLLLLVTFLFTLFFYGCETGKTKPKQEVTQKPAVTKEQEIQNKIDSLKSIAQDGDLITRMNDNIISEQARQLNDSDRSFSHAGVIVLRNNNKMVCHILPEKAGADTVLYEPIDSFINPKYNLLCGLFRYNLSDSERKAFISELEGYHKRKVHFDLKYDLVTDDVVYCSEMIYKSLKKVTHNRINCKLTLTPKRMIPVMTLFFKKYKFGKNVFDHRKFVTIDNLYLVPGCTELMRFPLKYFPGQ